MGSKCQIFVSLRTTITIFSDLKCIMMVKEIPRYGVIQCIEIVPNDLLVFNLNNVKNVSARNKILHLITGTYVLRVVGIKGHQK